MRDRTPGPWEAKKGPIYLENKYYITSEDGFIVAATGFQSEENAINAHLIAAAPDMLEVLQGLHKALARMIDKHDPDSIEAEWLQHSHEAILKAQGK